VNIRWIFKGRNTKWWVSKSQDEALFWIKDIDQLVFVSFAGADRLCLVSIGDADKLASSVSQMLIGSASSVLRTGKYGIKKS